MATGLCSLLGIEHPIVQGSLGGPFEIGPELIAAVCDASALGSVATTLRSSEQVRDDIRAVRELAGERPFAVDMTRRPFDEAVCAAVLAEAPAVVSPRSAPTASSSRRPASPPARSTRSCPRARSSGGSPARRGAAQEGAASA